MTSPHYLAFREKLSKVLEEAGEFWPSYLDRCVVLLLSFFISSLIVPFLCVVWQYCCVWSAASGCQLACVACIVATFSVAVRCDRFSIPRGWYVCLRVCVCLYMCACVICSPSGWSYPSSSLACSYSHCYALAHTHAHAYTAAMEMRDVGSSLLMGFQAATSAGPMAEEPVMGVCFVLESLDCDPEQRAAASAYGPVSGQLISAARECCRAAMMAAAPRLREAMFECSLDVLCTLSALLLFRPCS